MLLLLQPHGAEQEAKKRTLKMSQTLDRFFKNVSRPPTNERYKINLNDDYNKKYIHNSCNKNNNEQNQLHVHIQ